MAAPGLPTGRAAVDPVPGPLAFMTELLPAANAAPAADASAAPAVSDARPLRVMSFNVRFGTAEDGEDRWERRKDLLVRTIEAFGPDLLGVQEAIDFQCDALAGALGAYVFHGAGRENGRRKGEFTGIFFKRDRFDRLDADHFWLSTTPDVPGSRGWDAELPRMASWVKLRDRAAPGEPPVLFVNTHWDHMGKRARFESAKLIRARVRAILPDGPVVIVGDFNAREDDEEYVELVRAADDDGPRYVDAFRAAHPDRTTEEASFHGFKGGIEGIRIDWIIHSESLIPLEAGIDRTHENGRYPSDHYPVTAVLARKSGTLSP